MDSRATSRSATHNTPPDVNIESVSDSPRSVLNDGTKEVFTCGFCPKSFSRRENLSRHLKTHDSSKPHCCAICGKGFTRSDLLKRHEAGHERWDREDVNSKTPGTGTAKRRKVAFKGPEPDTHLPPLWPSSVPDAGPSQSPYPPNVRNNTEHSQSPYGVEGTGQSPVSSMPRSSFVQNQELSPDYQNQHHHNVHPELRPQGQSHHQGNVYPSHHLSNDEAARFHLNSNPMDDIPFDFSSYLVPPDLGPTGNEWFSYDFYSAMRETGHDWGHLGAAYDPNMSTPGQDYGDLTDLATPENPNNSVVPQNLVVADNDYEKDDHSDDEPPNEASEEDKWPFQWNPNSRPVLKAHAIIIPENHPLLLTHSPRFDITEGTLLRLRSFLQLPSGREFHQSQKGTFILPSLAIINVFIRLFFEKFSAQMPVIHHATVNTNTDLPPPLLAAIVTIGALHSHVKHTRRFAIVLLDLVRWHLRIALECNNSLMREPYIIYAEALICHTGLWCGNKRAFELAEVVRGALVTYIRRVRFGDQFPKKATDTKEASKLTSEWKQWIAEESQRRLTWVIFSIDAQFPSILNLPPSISIGEVRNVGCPCDEEFWCATSARNWKNLLGPASVPPSRDFSTAVGPFLLPSGPTRLPALSLNPWSAFLVLISITHLIYMASQETMIAQSFDHDDEDDHLTPLDEQTKELRHSQLVRTDQLASSLAFWASTYLYSRTHTHPSSQHFHASSTVLHALSSILLYTSLSDLQGAIGKDGTAGIDASLYSLTLWARRNPFVAEQVAFDAVKAIGLLAPRQNNKGGSYNRQATDVRDVDTAQYGIITVFLCHVVLWVFSSVSPIPRKLHLLERLAADAEVRAGGFMDVVEKGLGLAGTTAPTGEEENTMGDVERDAPKVLFRSAAEMLTRLGTWGASLNLALLLHKRSEM